MHVGRGEISVPNLLTVLPVWRGSCNSARMKRDVIRHAFPDAGAAEIALIDRFEAGEGRVTIGTGDFPQGNGGQVTIRAALLRAVMTAPDAPALRLRGARVDGVLDLCGVTLAKDISLTNCHFSDPIEALNARLRGVTISGCHLAGLIADHAEFDGAVYLRADTSIKGEVSLAATRIAGDLQMCGVRLQAEGQDALFAPALTVAGSVYLGNYPYSSTESELTSEGALFLASADIGHDLFITRCAISPRDDLPAQSIFEESEEHGPNIALSLARARIGGILSLRDNQIARGVVNLAGAHAERLRDEPAGPGASYPIRLDGFTYEDFSRHTETDLEARLNWLERRPADTPFTAQPYEHLARVLVHMGHRDDAQAVRMRKERILRQSERQERAAAHGRGPRWWIGWTVDQVMWVTIGYGFRPWRALILAVVLIMGLGLFFQATWAAGDMTPNAAPILISADWINATRIAPDNPAALWSAPGQAGQDYETFNAFAYAADLVVPIVSFGQEDAWAPSTSRSPLGQAGWWLRWIAKGLGWIITALGAAALTGIVRNE